MEHKINIHTKNINKLFDRGLLVIAENPIVFIDRDILLMEYAMALLVNDYRKQINENIND